LRKMVRRVYWSIRKPLQIPLAFIWRRFLFRTTVIGITGSVGKTTTKEMVYAILSAQAPTVQTADNQNDMQGNARGILSARFKTKYLIIEYGTSRPGQIAKIGRLVKPHIAIAISVAKTHTRSFNTLEDTAKEKAEIFNYMAKGATAIINIDDPYVCDMAKQLQNKALRFGSTTDCDIQHSAAESIWPQRLGLHIKSGDESQFVQTQLVGTHWASSVAAAVSIASACGVSLADSAKAIAKMPPFIARMQPVGLPCGATLIRDEYNGSEETFEKMIAVLEQAQAKRVVLVMSDFSDSKAKASKRQKRIGKMAAQLTSLAIFCSDSGHHAKKAAIAAGMDPENCHHVMGLRATSALMKETLREGDLVFLKGWCTEHLSRLVFAQYGEFACWSENCRYTCVCDVCGELSAKFDLRQMVKSV